MMAIPRASVATFGSSFPRGAITSRFFSGSFLIFLTLSRLTLHVLKLAVPYADGCECKTVMTILVPRAVGSVVAHAVHPHLFNPGSDLRISVRCEFEKEGRPTRHQAARRLGLSSDDPAVCIFIVLEVPA